MSQALPSSSTEVWRDLQAAFGRTPLVLYVAGPLRGDGSPECIRYNQNEMRLMAQRLQVCLPDAVLVVPHGNFYYVDEAGSGGLAARDRVLQACKRLLLRCEGLILCGSALTQGMAMEKAVAEKAGLPIMVAPGWPPFQRL